jgi:hypothetical protein
MKMATRKLSGPALERYLARIHAQVLGADSEVAARLTRRAMAEIVSVRVRPGSVGLLHGGRLPLAAKRRLMASAPPAAHTHETVVAPAEAAPVVSEPPKPSAPFDPYVFGLVPVFQREGREGLLARLSGIANVTNLQQMARSQQIVLPVELRAGEADAGSVRTAIADAVARRIADRRAAAGDPG